MEALNAVRSIETQTPEAVLNLNNVRSESGAADNTSKGKPNGEARGDPKEFGGTQPTIERVAQAMENYVDSLERDLKIQIHKETGNIMVSVISKEDGKTIREIPSEELLNLAARMEEMTGVIVNEFV